MYLTEQQRTDSGQETLAQLQIVVAAWDRLYALINPRDAFPLNYANLAEDIEFREMQSARAAIAAAADPSHASTQTEFR